ncbi:MAG: hypothetical protein L0229_27355 [Blastocatellia bacterium]|nr:hypothetical protein [Blastocatellia bacterium]
MIEISEQISHLQGVLINNDILLVFADLDDFCQTFEPTFKTRLLETDFLQCHRKATMSLSEVMTIIVRFQQSGYRPEHL